MGPARRHPTPPRFLLSLSALLLLGILAGCEGTNLFEDPVTEPPPEAPGDEEPEDPDLLRYIEEGTLIGRDGDRLRFRWETHDPLRIHYWNDTPQGERAAVDRALEAIAVDGMPATFTVDTDGDIVVRTLPPEEYREVDPTRPWSHSRTFVTANESEGITEVEIWISRELDQPTLERAALHAIGHAFGIMGHPSFPGDRYVMAARPEEDDAPPVTFAPLERDAFRFLYSPEVQVGMTPDELREAFARWTP
jgi:hypothetical protein